MRFALALALCILLPSLAALADDVKAPAISEVTAARKAKKVEVQARITDETGVLSAICHHRDGSGPWESAAMHKGALDDVFRASFRAGTADVYWIEATDLLGNGPATYGTMSKPIAVVDESRSSGSEGKQSAQSKAAQKKAAPPIVQHSKPVGVLPAGEEVTLRARVRGGAPIASTELFLRDAADAADDVILPMRRIGPDGYEARIPPERAHGTIEYRIAVRDRRGLQTVQGEGQDKWYSLTFQPAAPAEPRYIFSVNPPARILPGKPIPVRAQITGPISGEQAIVPDRARLLFRGNDGQDQAIEMQPDPSGGLGGFKAEIPAQAGGEVYFQVLACDAAERSCRIDTGNRRKWHGIVIANRPAPIPKPLDSASSKLPSAVRQ
jgi:hypothetical protein